MRNNKKIVLEMYFVEKLRPVDIARKLNISKSAITQILQKDKRYTEEKEIRKNNNIKKHIETTKEFIKEQRKIKQFEKNLDNLVLKKMHNQASRELSETKTLSNMAYRSWNISAYKYNPIKKRFEFKEELGKSADVPKYININKF